MVLFTILRAVLYAYSGPFQNNFKHVGDIHLSPTSISPTSCHQTLILYRGKVKKSCDGLVLNFLDRLFKAKQSFFDVTPKGQILARIR